MRPSASRLLCAAAAAVAIAGALTAFAAAIPDNIAAAVADVGRPDADKARDAVRKPAEMMVFAAIKPGQSVLELMPARGYYTRILAKVIGPKGHLYSAQPIMSSAPDAKPMANGISADPHYGNVTDLTLNAAGLAAVPPVDVVWTSDNYHDFHLYPTLSGDLAAFNKRMFALLKPGGEYIVIDHSARDGSGLDDNKLHRIDEAVVKQEAVAAGFVFESESPLLHNPADPRTAAVFDPSIRGHVDDFALKFRKPKK